MQPDKDSFLHVLADHQLIIFKVANSYCQTTDDREDLVQEIILQLWKSFPKYNPQYKLSTWIYRIALNISISHFRRSKTRAKHLRPFANDVIQVAAPQADENLQEDLEILHRFIHQLKDIDRALMILYLDGKSQLEIGEILDITPSNVGTRVNRIKKQLKTKFQILNHE